MPMSEVSRSLQRLQLLTTTVLATGIISILGFAGFSVYSLAQIHGQQTQLEQLTQDLCVTLERAGILIRGSQENPCVAR